MTIDFLKIRNKSGDTALHLAFKVFFRDDDYVSDFADSEPFYKLLTHDLLMIRNNEGKTPFHRLFSEHQPGHGLDYPVLEGFIKSKCPKLMTKDLMMVQDNLGQTVMHLIFTILTSDNIEVIMGCVEFRELLTVSLFEIKNNKGQTPIDILFQDGWENEQKAWMKHKSFNALIAESFSDTLDPDGKPLLLKLINDVAEDILESQDEKMSYTIDSFHKISEKMSGLLPSAEELEVAKATRLAREVKDEEISALAFVENAFSDDPTTMLLGPGASTAEDTSKSDTEINKVNRAKEIKRKNAKNNDSELGDLSPDIELDPRPAKKQKKSHEISMEISAETVTPTYT